MLIRAAKRREAVCILIEEHGAVRTGRSGPRCDQSPSQESPSHREESSRSPREVVHGMFWIARSCVCRLMRVGPTEMSRRNSEFPNRRFEHACAGCKSPGPCGSVVTNPGRGVHHDSLDSAKHGSTSSESCRQTNLRDSPARGTHLPRQRDPPCARQSPGLFVEHLARDAHAFDCHRKTTIDRHMHDHLGEFRARQTVGERPAEVQSQLIGTM